MELIVQPVFVHKLGSWHQSLGIDSQLLRIWHIALAGVAQWIEYGLQMKESLVRFPVGAHARVAGQVPSAGHVTGNHTLMFLSLSPPQ